MPDMDQHSSLFYHRIKGEQEIIRVNGTLEK
jgi:hypothetical protein